MEELLNNGYCHFVNYGEEERRCVRCGYIIPTTDNDYLTLVNMIYDGYPEPDCKINKNKMDELLKKCENLFKNLSKKLGKKVKGKIIDTSKIDKDKFGIQLYIDGKEMKIVLIKRVVDDLENFHDLNAVEELEIMILDEIQNG